MALCLNPLLQNKRAAPFILINDSIQFSGLPLLAEFASSTLRDNQTLVVVLTETSPAAWVKRLQPIDNSGRIHIIDAYTDPLGWDAPDINVPKGVATLEPVRDIRDMERTILNPIMQKTDTECCILIDSIHPLLMVSQQRTYQLIKALESLTTDAIRLVVSHHADTELPRKSVAMIPVVAALNRLASVIITLEPVPERTLYDTQEALTGFTAQESFTYMKPTSNLVEKGGVASVEWRKKSGKVQYQTDGFYLGRNGLIVVPASKLMGEVAEQVSMDIDQLQPQQMDPTANLSFNLSLTDNQRRAKDNVELPYMKVQQQPSSGNIYYEPDAGDDFDDEDPDDDLDI